MALLLISTLFLVGALALGLLISAVSRNQFVAGQIAIVSAFLPAFMLSGFVFQIDSMPLPIRLLTYVFPARYLVSALQTLFLVGDIWAVLWPNLAGLAVIAAVLLLITARHLPRRLD
jgi:ABC-2 type transport system permease protein